MKIPLGNTPPEIERGSANLPAKRSDSSLLPYVVAAVGVVAVLLSVAVVAVSVALCGMSLAVLAVVVRSLMRERDRDGR